MYQVALVPKNPQMALRVVQTLGFHTMEIREHSPFSFS